MSSKNMGLALANKILLALVFLAALAIRYFAFEGYLISGTDPARHLMFIQNNVLTGSVAQFSYPPFYPTLLASLIVMLQPSLSQTLILMRTFGYLIDALIVFPLFVFVSQVKSFIGIVASFLATTTAIVLGIYQWGGYPTFLCFYLIATYLALLGRNKINSLKGFLVGIFLLAVAISLHPTLIIIVLGVLTMCVVVEYLRRQKVVFKGGQLSAGFLLFVLFLFAYHYVLHYPLPSLAAVVIQTEHPKPATWIFQTLYNIYFSTENLAITALTLIGLYFLISQKFPNIFSMKLIVLAWLLAPHIGVFPILTDWLKPRLLLYLAQPLAILSSFGVYGIIRTIRDLVLLASSKRNQILKVTINATQFIVLGTIIVILVIQGAWTTLILARNIQMGAQSLGITRAQFHAITFLNANGNSAIVNIANSDWISALAKSYPLQEHYYLVSTVNQNVDKIYDNGKWGIYIRAQSRSKV
ncbi:hypothetical protein KEJ26_07180 [Candidatus Bathyarchaeota archaeon]|nr:hypothetical protein [Candidatus Bathyarchaeota archaeon]